LLLSLILLSSNTYYHYIVSHSSTVSQQVFDIVVENSAKLFEYSQT
jgi:hypothetical protein